MAWWGGHSHSISHSAKPLMGHSDCLNPADFDRKINLTLVNTGINIIFLGPLGIKRYGLRGHSGIRGSNFGNLSRYILGV